MLRISRHATVVALTVLLASNAVFAVPVAFLAKGGDTSVTQQDNTCLGGGDFPTYDWWSGKTGCTTAVAVYKTVVASTGTGYSAVTGKFTAPYNGVYTFSASVRHVGNASAQILTKVGSAPQQLAFFETFTLGIAGHSFMTTHTVLNKNQVVWVQLNPYAGANLQADHNDYFSGALISRLDCV